MLFNLRSHICEERLPLVWRRSTERRRTGCPLSLYCPASRSDWAHEAPSRLQNRHRQLLFAALAPLARLNPKLNRQSLWSRAEALLVRVSCHCRPHGETARGHGRSLRSSPGHQLEAAALLTNVISLSSPTRIYKLSSVQRRL